MSSPLTADPSAMVTGIHKQLRLQTLKLRPNLYNSLLDAWSVGSSCDPAKYSDAVTTMPRTLSADSWLVQM